jgi:hypothetical protein
MINIGVAVKDNYKHTRLSYKLNLSILVIRQKDNQQRHDKPSVTKYGNEHATPFVSVVEVFNYRAESE